jgi:hypothetical protein
MPVILSDSEESPLRPSYFMLRGTHERSFTAVQDDERMPLRFHKRIFAFPPDASVVMTLCVY